MEIEIKLKYKNKQAIKNLLQQKGFTKTQTKTIDDTYFGKEGTSMLNADSFYRIRTINHSSNELTLKDNFVSNNGVSTRRELNITIDNPDTMTIILESLGCHIFKENASLREIWQKDGLTVEFIHYTKPAELEYIEIEGKTEAEVSALVEELGHLVEVGGEDLFSNFDEVV